MDWNSFMKFASRFKKSLAAAGIVSAMALGSVAMAAPAQAATPNGAYDGTYANTTGCDATASTIATRQLKNSSGTVIGNLEVRYSSACDTNWVRMNTTIPGAATVKTIMRPYFHSPYGGSNPYFSQTETDVTTAWSFGQQAYAPSWQPVQVRGVITQNGVTLADTGEVWIS